MKILHEINYSILQSSGEMEGIKGSKKVTPRVKSANVTMSINIQNSFVFLCNNLIRSLAGTHFWTIKLFFM